MSDNDPRHQVECARPQGTGFEVLDLPLAREMQELLAAGKANSPTDAARQVAHRARGASPEAIVDRLVRLQARLFPVNPGGQRGRESDSVRSMTPIAAAPAAPDADLAARVAFLEARAAEYDTMMTDLIGSVTQLVKAQVKANEIALRQDDRLERQADSIERFADAAEQRLDAAGVPRSVSTKH